MRFLFYVLIAFYCVGLSDTDSVSSAVSTRVGVDASLAASNILLGNTLSAQIVTVYLCIYKRSI